ncbi:MAG TPA: TolC family protein [Geobacteraceae bacterium]
MKSLAVLAFAVVLVPGLARADDGKVTLREAIKLALERNHLLKSAAFQRSAAARDISISRSRYFPRVRFDETLSASNSPTNVFMMKLNEGRFSPDDFMIDRLNHPAHYNDFQTAFTIEQPLFDVSIGRGAELSEKEDAAQGFILERRRQDVGFGVYQACLGVQKAKSFLGVAEQAAADAREHERLARVRNEAGMGLKSDELRARTFLAEMEQQLISAQNALVLARLRLAQVTGGEPGESLEVSEEIRAPQNVPGSEELSRLALENRQDLQEAAAIVEKADAGVRLARGSYLPTVYASAAYQMNDRDIPFGRDNDSWQAGVNLRWELFDGMRRSNEAGKARALRSSAAEYLENYRREVLLQVTESGLNRAEAAKRLEVARHAVRDAEEGVRLVGKRFEGSLATMVELLDAETALTRSRALVVESESDLALATARLYQAAGIFLKEVGQ